VDLPLAVIEKRRTLDGSRTEIYNLIGDVRKKNVIVVDDEIDTAQTLVKAVDFIKEQGARDICACATHAVLSEPAVDRIRNSHLKEVIVTDTVAISEDKCQRSGGKITVIPVAPLLADVIYRIHEGRSVGELFNE
jgi:ribose-phosphate pyrophosphokinase